MIASAPISAKYLNNFLNLGVGNEYSSIPPWTTKISLSTFFFVLIICCELEIMSSGLAPGELL